MCSYLERLLIYLELYCQTLKTQIVLSLIYEALLLASRINCRCNTHAFRSASKADCPQAKQYHSSNSKHLLSKSFEMFLLAKEIESFCELEVDLLPRFQVFYTFKEELKNVG